MIEQELKDITSAIMKRAEMGQATQREIAEVLEAWAKLDDLYTDIQDRCMLDGMFTDGVTAKIDGVTVKFENTDGLAEWLSNGLE